MIRLFPLLLSFSCCVLFVLISYIVFLLLYRKTKNGLRKKKMEFCSRCESLLQLSLHRESINEDNSTGSAGECSQKTMRWACAVCSNETNLSSSETTENSDSLFSTRDDETLFYRSRPQQDHALFYNTLVNRFSSCDSTLPVTCSVKCPNCVKQSSGDSDVTYFMYGNINMQFLYHCKRCEYTWKRIKVMGAFVDDPIEII